MIKIIIKVGPTTAIFGGLNYSWNSLAFPFWVGGGGMGVGDDGRG